MKDADQKDCLHRRVLLVFYSGNISWQSIIYQKIQYTIGNADY